MDNAKFFHYKTGNSFLHKIPAWIKIILILVLAICSFYAPVKICIILFPIFLLFSFFLLNFTLSEIYSDLKPTIAYTILLYFATLILNLTTFLNTEEKENILKIFVPNTTYIPLLVHLALSMQITSIFYRTTSIGQFKEGFSTIEKFFTKKDSSPISDTLSLTISFIPRIATFWNQIEKAWKARGGKENPQKILALIPRLFQVSMRFGYEKSLAITNRQL